MFGPFIRVALLTSLLSTPLAANIRSNNVLPLQDEMQQIKTAVESALPSDWKVIGAKANRSLWPTADELRDRYKGYAIELAGPTYKTETSDKMGKKTYMVTAVRVAILYFIPVWNGINRGQLTKDLKKGRLSWDSTRPGEQGESDWRPDESVAYGWNSRYLLVCKHDCGVTGRVAKKFKIPKR